MPRVHSAVVRCSVILLVLVTASVLVACGSTGATTVGATGAGTAAPGGSKGSPAVDPASGLRIVRLDDLPTEATQVVALIAAGGPFPYRQDGVTFENREGLLPDRPSGYDHEYTVPTPGSSDRGPRRIITGREGQMYWTADHYDSFAWIAR
jgi:ribonuclease T1